MSERFGKVWGESDRLVGLVALEDEGRLLRHVMADGCRIVLWDTFEVDRYGKSKLGYALWDREGRKVFDKEDYFVPAVRAIGSDRVVRDLLGFLTLSLGDTDSEYFVNYTDAVFVDDPE